MIRRTHKGRYYNGISPLPFTVDITLFDNELHIDYWNELKEPVHVVWKKLQIIEWDATTAVVSLKYTEQHSNQQLDVTDRDFINEYFAHFKKKETRKLLKKHSTSWIASWILGFIGFLLACYFWLLPFVADSIANHFPKDYEIAMGNQIYESVLTDEKVDETKTTNINRFFKQMKVEGDYPVHIIVVKKNIPNAFALPGGGMVVYSQIIDSMQSYEQLAALLAHEYSHVQLKHTTRGIFRNLAGYLFVSLLFSDANGIANIIIQNANNLRNLSYSRDLEHEADMNGLQILANNHVDVNGMKRLFIELKKENQIDLNEMLSTHPDLDERIKSVEAFKRENKFTIEKNDSMEYYFMELRERK